MDKEKLFQQYVEGELTPEEEKEALHIIAEDSELRSLLRFEQEIAGVFSDPAGFESIEVPEGFSARVMNRIEKLEREERDAPSEVVKEWFESLWLPRPVRLRPIYGVAAVILLSLTLSLSLFVRPDGSNTQQQVADNQSNRSIQQVSETGQRVWLRFVYFDGEAEAMSVAGDFSNWKPIELTKQTVNGNQVWTGLVSMKRGEHEYMFIKDGEQWITDPLAPVTRDDGFGNKNAVIYL